MFKDLCRIGILLNALACSPVVVDLLVAQDEVSFLAARRDFAVGLEPDSIIVGDFNNDKIQDLATANIRSNDVSILLGNGDGTFQSAQNFEVGRSPWSVAVGDFNGDALSDLAVANVNSSQVSVLLGHGDGTFGLAQNVRVGSYPSSVAVGDFNGDEIPDLATTNQLLCCPSRPGTVSVLLGVGDGTFGPVQNFGVGHLPRSARVADVNGDGIADLVVANGDSNNVSILLGVGDGTFAPAQHFGVGLSPTSVAIGDFNGDNLLDLAVAHYASNHIFILINDTPQR